MQTTPTNHNNHTHLCFVLASSALEGVGLKVSNGNEATEVTDMDPVGIGDVVQSFVEELSSSVGYLTITFHFTKSEAPITRKGGISNHKS